MPLSTRDAAGSVRLGIAGDDGGHLSSGVPTGNSHTATRFEHAVTCNGGPTAETDTFIWGDTIGQLEAHYSDAPRRYVQPSQLTLGEGRSANLSPSPNVAYPIVADWTVGPDDELGGRQRAREAVARSLSAIQSLLSHYYLVPAIRGFDELSYDVLRSATPSLLDLGPSPATQAHAVVNYLASVPEIAKRLAESLSSILGRGFDLTYRLDTGRVVTETESAGQRTNLLNEAFGLNQLMGPLLWLTIAPTGSIVGIEEPEIHLHPRAQASLADFLLQTSLDENKQIILTTHSEHIPMAFLTAVTNNRISSRDLVVYELEREDGTAIARRARVNEYGQIEGGLKGFLEVDLDEIGDFIRATVSRQQA